MPSSGRGLFLSAVFAEPRAVRMCDCAGLAADEPLVVIMGDGFLEAKEQTPQVEHSFTPCCRTEGPRVVSEWSRSISQARHLGAHRHQLVGTSSHANCVCSIALSLALTAALHGRWQ
jgi:hypothetical protein